MTKERYYVLNESLVPHQPQEDAEEHKIWCLNAKNHPFGWFLNNPAPCYFPLTSIIAAAGLNFGVRDGNQWSPRAKSTGLKVLLVDVHLLLPHLGWVKYTLSRLIAQDRCS